MIAQNLVPNPSFELHDSCPDNEDQIQRAIGWSKYSNIASTPDYYNACDTGGQLCVPPVNGGFTQSSAHSGHAYGAVVTFAKQIHNYREYIGIQLSQSLTIGQDYFLSFYTTTGEVWGLGMPSNNLGIRLSTVAFNPNNPTPINNYAHLYSSAIISDTINWVHVSGTITADSTYHYLVIGNFFTDSLTDTICWRQTNSLECYYAVDDICITPAADSMICMEFTSVDEIKFPEDINVFPNPATDFVNIVFDENQETEIILFDMLGNTIYKNLITNKSARLCISAIPRGCYELKITSKRDYKTYIKKIVKL